MCTYTYVNVYMLLFYNFSLVLFINTIDFKYLLVFNISKFTYSDIFLFIFEFFRVFYIHKHID